MTLILVAKHPSYILHECNVFCTQLFLTITTEHERNFNGQYHAESKIFVNNTHHPIKQILLDVRYDKGLLTAVLRCAEVVGKKVPFLCLYKGYCFFIYYYKNALVFREYFGNFFPKNLMLLNLMHRMFFLVKSCESENVQCKDHSTLIVKIILLC